MPIDFEKLINFEIPEIEQNWTTRDTMLYALGLGLGADPLDVNQLKFVYERELQSLPTMPVVLCAPHGWLRHANVGMSGKSVHGEQSFVIHKQIPVEGAFVGKPKVASVVDKGPGKGMLVVTERNIYHKSTGDLLCSVSATSFCRGDGGFGGPSGPIKTPHPIPDRPPDFSCDLHILPQAALIYRLSGDYNALHADPETARKAGFQRPILQGLCTFGITGHAILKTCCDYDAIRLKGMEARFSAPVYPNEVLRTEMWKQNDGVSFRAIVPARDMKVVLNNGHATLAA